MAQLLNQFAYKVVNFSSQYGGHGTSSYVAKNLAGSCQVGERYGDFTTAFVLVSVSDNTSCHQFFAQAYIVSGPSPLNSEPITLRERLWTTAYISFVAVGMC